MNTFHIKPDSFLSTQAAEFVREFEPDTLLAIRGQTIDYGDEDPIEEVYTVSSCPDPENEWKYMWTYVIAREWLEAHAATYNQGVNNDKESNTINGASCRDSS